MDKRKARLAPTSYRVFQLNPDTSGAFDICINLSNYQWKWLWPTIGNFTSNINLRWNPHVSWDTRCTVSYSDFLISFLLLDLDGRNGRRAVQFHVSMHPLPRAIPVRYSKTKRRESADLQFYDGKSEMIASSYESSVNHAGSLELNLSTYQKCIRINSYRCSFLCPAMLILFGPRKCSISLRKCPEIISPLSLSASYCRRCERVIFSRR